MRKQIALAAAAAVALTTGAASVAQAAGSPDSVAAPVITTSAGDGKVKGASSWTQAKASAVIDWYAAHGIAVDTVTKSDGITYAIETESALRAAAAVKGVSWDPGSKAKKPAGAGK